MHDKGAVQPAWSHERLIEHVRSVRRSHDEDKRLRRNRAADDPEPAAWCLDCERLLTEEGEWTDRMGEFADLRLICDRCFEPFATGGLPTA